jgi:RNA polymerase sigma-70 factor (ECF subfamily)
MVNDDLDAELLAVLASGIRAMALRILEDADAANDAVQETLARALPRIRGVDFENRERLGAYVRGIAHHVITDVLRSRKRAQQVALTEAAGLVVDATALDDVIADEQRRHLQTAFADLSETDQQLLRLAFVDGLSSAQLSRSLGEPADRIRKRRSRALERLRRAFFGVEPQVSQVSRSAPPADYDVAVGSRATARKR